MKKLANAIAAILVILLATAPGWGSFRIEWWPSSEITILVGPQEEDAVRAAARHLAEDLKRSFGWRVRVEEVTEMDADAMPERLLENGHLWEVTTIKNHAPRIPRHRDPFGLYPGKRDFSYLSTIGKNMPALAAINDRGWRNIYELGRYERIRAGYMEGERRMGNRLMEVLYAIGRDIGVSFDNIPVWSCREGIQGVISGNLDITWVTDSQLKRGDGRYLMSLTGPDASLGGPGFSKYIHNLGYEVYPDYVMVMAHGNSLSQREREAIGSVIAEIVNDWRSKTHQHMTHAFSGPTAVIGERLEGLVAKGDQAIAC